MLLVYLQVGGGAEGERPGAHCRHLPEQEGQGHRLAQDQAGGGALQLYK